MPVTYEPIATQTLGSTAASITFSSIPSTYTDLRLVLVNTTSTAANLYMRFNSDTSTNYSSTHVAGNGSSVNNARYTNLAYARLFDTGATSTTVPTMVEIDIFSYNGSTNKTTLCRFSGDLNGSGATDSSVSLWRQTSAISTILLYPSGGTFSVGTTATLYGIKNA